MDPPLLTAVRWEKLRGGGAGQVDHVLFVVIDQVAAGTVTRQSLLGTSGRISFLGSANILIIVVLVGIRLIVG